MEGPYHPQSQGRVERFNQTLERQLGKYLTENNDRRWLEILPNIVRTYNITVHEVTNRSSFNVLYGWKASNWYKLPDISSSPNDSLSFGILHALNYHLPYIR
jgi:hypothetical protein